MTITTKTGKVIFIFLDGVGIGTASASNPFFLAQTDYLPFYQNGCILPDGTLIKPVDATMGVAGMPMSATGQTTLFTGVNVPKIKNEHKESFPDREMRKIIKEKNVFSALRFLNLKPRFINAFPGSSHLFTSDNVFLMANGDYYFSPLFQDRIRRPISVTTCMMIANNMVPFGEKEVQSRDALFHDYSNRELMGRSYDLPQYSPEEAAEILFKVSRKYDFLLYEYFLTDFYGHTCIVNESVDLVKHLNRLIKRLVSMLDKESDTLIITSDHGNLEDMNTQLHTTNPVPFFTWGFRDRELQESVESLVDVKSAVIDYFSNSNH